MAKKIMSLEEKLEEAIVKEVPYEVPSNWIWSKLQYVSTLVTGSTPQKKVEEYYGRDIAFIKPNDLGQGRRVRYSSEYLSCLGSSKARIIPKGSTAVCCIGSIGKAGYLEIDGATNQQINSIIPKGIIELYVYYYVLSEYFQKELKYNSSATTISIINKSKMGALIIPLPPLKEQQRIVDRIESLFKKLDKSKELIEEAKDEFEKRKASILEMAFSGELSSGYRSEHRVIENWNICKVKDVAKVTSGGTPSRQIPKYFEGDISWIKTGEIVWNRIYDSTEHITQEAVNNSSAKIIPSNSVLVAMYGQGLTRGRAAILEKEACTNQAVCALIPNEKVTSKFIYYYFMKNYWKFRQLAKGGNQENLSGKVIGEFEINLPSIAEQNEIIRILDKLLDRENEIKELTELEEQIELIKKSILAKAFRGELGTNCEEEESSLELLKEILRKQ